MPEVDFASSNAIAVLAYVLGPLLTAIVGIVGAILTKRYSDSVGADELKKLSEGLHQAVMNGLKAALAKRGLVGANLPTEIGEDILFETIGYARTTNPDAIEKFKPSTDTLKNIALAKMADLAAAQPPVLIPGEALTTLDAFELDKQKKGRSK